MMTFVFRRIAAIGACLATGLLARGAIAACLLGMVDRSPLLHLASTAPVPAQHVRVTYVGHSSFLIETPEGATAVTDYNGMNIPAVTPDIVTMNNAHSTHYTDAPSPGIRYVLRGWSEKTGGGPSHHDVRHRDLRVFNVPTNIGEYGDPTGNANSIFVFEISGLCIAHLGHLHHVLTQEQLRKLGRIDVLFVPVDGSSTMTHPQAMAVIDQIAPRLIFPMHWGFLGSPDAFFELAREKYTIRSEKGSTLTVSRPTLPKNTEIVFLQGGGGF